ncbi:hypothetical protein L1049_013293 [Liquidambar formosana]|uniref:Phytocyanin domain-containing protein n=1 Tax=Liquidambar formosana TaxID=63359 RepID=A0AAP0RKG2_LIQFO
MAAASSIALSSTTLVLLLLFSFSEAREFLVGGNANAWNIPNSQSNSESLNQWAQSSRFRVSDTLVWKYDSTKDSVLRVTKEGYASCNTSDPIEEYKDGNTKVKLDKSGPHYFISGAAGHCEKGQKVIVVVLSARHRFMGISPAPAPVEFEGGPAVAPISGATSLEGSLMVALGVLVGFVLM